MCFKEVFKHFCCYKKNEIDNKKESNSDSKKMSVKQLLNHINDETSNEIFFEKEELKINSCKLDFRNGEIYKRRTNKLGTNLKN